MSEHLGDDDWSTRTEAEVLAAGPTGEPAIGLDVTGAASDTVAGSILDLYRHGHEPIVAHDGTPNEDVREVLHQLEVEVVEARDETIDESLIEVARKAGFPGLIIHRNLEQSIDFEQSVEALHNESNQYAVESVIDAEADDGWRIIVGIPAYNESVAIGSQVLEAKQYSSEVIVVDDGSSDGTAEIAAKAGATVLRHEENRGKGATLRTLFDHLDTMDYDTLVLMDGDGQHHAQYIPELAEPVYDGDADVTIGSRYLESSTDGETPRYRRFGQRILDVLTMGTTGMKVTDSQSGFRALSPTAVESIDLQGDGFEVESEMIDAAVEEGFTIEERPIDVRYAGVDGSTSNPFRHGLAVVTFVLQLIRDRHPLVFFGVPGLILTTIGVLYGLDGILIYQSQGTFYPAKAMVAGFLTIIGVLGVFIGLVLNRIANLLGGFEE